MSLTYLKDVVSLTLSAPKCVGCGLCAIVCPHGVFAVRDGKARMAKRDACMECGACAMNCPTKAISVDPGVGCAAAFINGWLTGSEPSCDCAGSSKGKCC